MAEKINILMISFGKSDRQLIETELRNARLAANIVGVSDTAQLRKQIAKSTFDIAIAAWETKKLPAQEVLHVLSDHGQPLPLIVISKTRSEEHAVTAIRAGAKDYIVTSGLSRLVPAIQRELKESSARKKQEHALKALRETQRRFAYFMLHLPGAAYLKDSDGHFVYVNERFRSLFPVKKKQIIGATVDDIWPSEMARAFKNADRQVLRTGHSVETVEKLEVECSDRYFLTIRFPIPGSQPLIGGISLDITDHRLKNREITRIAGELLLERNALQRKDIALQQVLGSIGSMSTQTRNTIAANFEQRIMPALHKIRAAVPESLHQPLDILEKELHDVASPFLISLSSANGDLTARETEICGLIKQGLTSKEIAEHLNLAPATIRKHRESIRRKLGLAHKNLTLHKYLSEIT